MHDQRETPRWMSRRRFLTRAVGGVSAAVLALRSRKRAVAFDNCFWETRQTVCSGGRLLKYRCEVCCAGGVCETVQCVWVDFGPC